MQRNPFTAALKSLFDCPFKLWATLSVSLLQKLSVCFNVLRAFLNMPMWAALNWDTGPSVERHGPQLSGMALRVSWETWPSVERLGPQLRDLALSWEPWPSVETLGPQLRYLAISCETWPSVERLSPQLRYLAFQSTRPLTPPALGLRPRSCPHWSASRRRSASPPGFPGRRKKYNISVSSV